MIPERPIRKRMWERLEGPTYRMWVPAGWVIRYEQPHAAIAAAMVFVPDPDHQWNPDREV